MLQLKQSLENLGAIKRITIACRYFTLEAKSEEIICQMKNVKRAGKTTQKLKSNYETKVVKEISAYFGSPGSENILQSFPEKLLKRKKAPEGFYIATESAAKQIFDALKSYKLQPDKPIIEVNPGLGLLTKHLVNETGNDLILFEPIESFHSNISVSKNVVNIITTKIKRCNAFRI